MTKEELIAFKHRLANYEFLKKKIEENSIQIELLYDRLANVHSITYGEVGGTTNQLEVELKKHELREKIKKHELNIKQMQNEVDKLDEMLNQLEEETRKVVIIKMIKGRTYEYLSKKLYVDKSTLLRKITRALMRINYEA